MISSTLGTASVYAYANLDAGAAMARATKAREHRRRKMTIKRRAANMPTVGLATASSSSSSSCAATSASPSSASASYASSGVASPSTLPQRRAKISSTSFAHTSITSSSPSRKPRPSAVDQDRVDRKVRNRLSAAASRKRKNDKVANLESRVGDLEEENAALRRRMEHMERLARQHGAASAPGFAFASDSASDSAFTTDPSSPSDFAPPPASPFVSPSASASAVAANAEAGARPALFARALPNGNHVDKHASFFVSDIRRYSLLETLVPFGSRASADRTRVGPATARAAAAAAAC